MDDLISRQGTIDRINEYIEEYSEIDSDGNHSEKWCAMQEAKMTIENMPPAQPEQRIPCSERLPEDDEIVLVSDGIDYAVAFWRFDAETWDDPLHGWLDSFEFNVKAWRTLPEPYTERREG